MTKYFSTRRVGAFLGFLFLINNAAFADAAKTSSDVPGEKVVASLTGGGGYKYSEIIDSVDMYLSYYEQTANRQVDYDLLDAISSNITIYGSKEECEHIFKRLELLQDAKPPSSPHGKDIAVLMKKRKASFEESCEKRKSFYDKAVKERDLYERSALSYAGSLLMGRDPARSQGASREIVKEILSSQYINQNYRANILRAYMMLIALGKDDPSKLGELLDKLDDPSKNEEYRDEYGFLLGMVKYYVKMYEDAGKNNSQTYLILKQFMRRAAAL